MPLVLPEILASATSTVSTEYLLLQGAPSSLSSSPTVSKKYLLLQGTPSSLSSTVCTECRFLQATLNSLSFSSTIRTEYLLLQYTPHLSFSSTVSTECLLQATLLSLPRSVQNAFFFKLPSTPLSLSHGQYRMPSSSSYPPVSYTHLTLPTSVYV